MPKTLLSKTICEERDFATGTFGSNRIRRAKLSEKIKTKHELAVRIHQEDDFIMRKMNHSAQPDGMILKKKHVNIIVSHLIKDYNAIMGGVKLQWFRDFRIGIRAKKFTTSA